MKVYERNGVYFPVGDDSYDFVLGLLDSGMRSFTRHENKVKGKCSCKNCKNFKKTKGFSNTWWDIPDRSLVRMLKKIRDKKEDYQTRITITKWLNKHKFNLVFDSGKRV